MPYYVYRVRPFAQLSKLAEFVAYGEASAHAKALRAAEAGASNDGRIQIMFADDETQAEDLLCQVRTAGPSGDE